MSETKKLTNAILKEKMVDAMVDRGLCLNLDALLPPGIYLTNANTTGTFPPRMGDMVKYAVVEVMVRYTTVLQRVTNVYGDEAVRASDGSGNWRSWKEPVYYQ